MASEQPGMIVNGGPAATSSLSPAEVLRQQHEREHGAQQPTVQDTVDVEDKQHPPPSWSHKEPSATGQSESRQAYSGVPTPAANQTPAQGPQGPGSVSSASSTMHPPAFDGRSEELFPALGGGPKPRPAGSTVPAAWSGRNPNLTNGKSNASSPAAAPPAGLAQPHGAFGPPKEMTIPGKHVERIRFAPSQMLPRNQLKKPLADIVRDTSKKSTARVDIRDGPNGSYVFEGVGSVDSVRQALKEIAQQVGSKQTVRVSVPASARPHIIGRQGAVVQAIHDRTGARVQVPRPADSGEGDDDDDDNTIDVVIEGDAVSAEMARREIENVVESRASNVTMRLKSVPPELFPFIAGAHDTHVKQLQERTETQIRVPRYDTWSRPPPQEAPPGQIQFAPDQERHIHISGGRTAAQEARAEIERRAQELQREITLRQFAINRGQHQFILGDKKDSLHEFFAETGCSIVLPPASDDTEFLTITGPPDRIESGVNHAMDLATSMQMASVDLSRQYPNAPAGPHTHARALTSYLQQREVIKELESLYDAHIVLPLPSSTGPVTWEVYSRDGKNTIRARSDIVNLAQAYPPSRLVTVPVDPYFHSHLRSHRTQQLRNDFGVRLIVPDGDGNDSHVVLVYEYPPDGATREPPAVPRRAPSNDEVVTFQKVLKEAQTSLLAALGDQSDIVETRVNVPSKYQEKLKKFVARDQAAKGEDYIPVRVTVSPDVASLRGRFGDVEQLVSKVQHFVEEQVQDELERGNITTFDFPQKFAHFLIGRKGENINRLRDEFDVDIKIENGKVEIKGPKAKAEKAKADITAMAKKLEDEATYVLKIAPQYHKDLIGQRGSMVNRLQDRYKVRVQFPRAATSSPAGDEDAASDVGSTRINRAPQSPDEVVVRGPRKGADSARDEILGLYQWYIDHSHTGTVSVAQSQIPSLIGQRGREMDKLRADTEAQIDVPGVDEAADASGRVQIKLKGTKKQVDEARKLLLQRAKDFDETVTRTIDVDKKHHKSLIGGGGANIRKIVVEAGGPDARMVKFPRADSDESTIRLEGKETIVNNVVAAIEEFVRQKEDQVTTAIDVPQSQHRLLIGRGGDARRQLEQQFNISLDVPRQGSGRTDVQLKGPSNAVEDAKNHILSLVQEHQGATVHVPRRLHHTVADNGQFFRRLRNEHQVTVDHAGEQVPPQPAPASSRNTTADGADASLPLITDDPAGATDSYSWKVVDINPPESSDESTIPWVLSGTSDNVAKAKAALEKAIATASQQSSTGYLILPDPKTYRFIVGPGGNRINSIRSSTNCKINVPKDQAKGEAIELKGSKDDLEKAKNMILDAVKSGSNGASGR